MGDKKIYIVAKIFDKQGCLAYLCKTVSEARCLPETMEDIKEFIDKVSQMNRVA